MIIYDSFVSSIGSNGHVNMFVYHCEESLFLRILERSLGGFDYYLIIPHFKSDALSHLNIMENVIEMIEKIPKEKLIIIDNDQIQIKGNYTSVYQDFKNDIFTPLKELLGITVISTDFKAMGEIAANFVLKNKKGKIKNEFKYIERNSV